MLAISGGLSRDRLGADHGGASQSQQPRSGKQGPNYVLHTRGFRGGSRLAFESIVEEVRRFVARMPPVDYSAGSACYLRNFSALGDQRAEFLPVQRPRTLSLSARRMMRLTRTLIFPYFSLSITDQLPPTSRGFPQCPEKLSLETRKGYMALTGQST